VLLIRSAMCVIPRGGADPWKENRGAAQTLEQFFLDDEVLTISQSHFALPQHIQERSNSEDAPTADASSGEAEDKPVTAQDSQGVLDASQLQSQLPLTQVMPTAKPASRRRGGHGRPGLKLSTAADSNAAVVDAGGPVDADSIDAAVHQAEPASGSEQQRTGQQAEEQAKQTELQAGPAGGSEQQQTKQQAGQQEAEQSGGMGIIPEEDEYDTAIRVIKAEQAAAKLKASEAATAEAAKAEAATAEAATAEAATAEAAKAEAAKAEAAKAEAATAEAAKAEAAKAEAAKAEAAKAEAAKAEATKAEAAKAEAAKAEGMMLPPPARAPQPAGASSAPAPAAKSLIGKGPEVVTPPVAPLSDAGAAATDAAGGPISATAGHESPLGHAGAEDGGGDTERTHSASPSGSPSGPDGRSEDDRDKVILLHWQRVITAGTIEANRFCLGGDCHDAELWAEAGLGDSETVMEALSSYHKGNKASMGTVRVA
jgi:hypothetical protein